MAAHVIGDPSDSDGLTSVSTRDDEEDGGVLCTDGNGGLGEQHRVPDGSDADAEHAEGVAVAEVVGGEGDAEAYDGGDDEDGDAVDLGLDGGEAHLCEDGGREELVSDWHEILSRR